MLIALEITCALLLAIGLLFTVLEFRTAFDKSFRYFGLALLILSSMAGIDIWVTPTLDTMEEKLYWYRIILLLSCALAPFSIKYLLLITRREARHLTQAFILSSIVVGALVFTSGMMVISGDKLVGGPLYNFILFPYALLYVVSANTIIIIRLRKSDGQEKRILWQHLLGFQVLCFMGLLDMTGYVIPSAKIFISFKLLGILAFGIVATLIFVERFLTLLKDRDTTFAKLESAYRDLEQVNALKQIGESTAIINHEIKNYMFMISGNAQILGEMEHLSQKGKDIVRNIVTSVERLTLFSDDILKMSRVQVTREKHPVNLTELVKGVVEKHYPDRRDAIVLQGMERDHFLFGDWGKLEQAFVNVFNNSFEAGQGRPVEIKVRVTDGPSLLLVSVEDNGVGCDNEQLGNLFKAFYTTKKYQGGTGLGMSITRTIIESHGGKVSAYSKNLARKDDHGLKLIMSFPIYAQSLAEEAQRKHPIVLIKDGMDNLTDIIRVFQNVKVTPRIIQGAEELTEADFPPDSMTVLVSAKTMASQFTRLSQFPKLCLVSHHERNLYVLDYGRGNRPEVFSEEYVITRLIQKASPRTRLRERQVHTIAA